jgi:hypothetical protein
MNYLFDPLPLSWPGGVQLFFAFAILHALADYPLQGTFLASAKIPGADLSVFFGNSRPPRFLWVHALTAHSLIHAGGVWILCGSPILAFAEFFLHWIIDYLKCIGKTNLHVDQAIHLVCKLAYTIVLLAYPAAF